MAWKKWLMLSVNLPSDCKMMKGEMLPDERCRVPAGGRVLKPAVQVTGKICHTPGCEG